MIEQRVERVVDDGLELLVLSVEVFSRLLDQSGHLAVYFNYQRVDVPLVDMAYVEGVSRLYFHLQDVFYLFL